MVRQIQITLARAGKVSVTLIDAENGVDVFVGDLMIDGDISYRELQGEVVAAIVMTLGTPVNVRNMRFGKISCKFLHPKSTSAH